MRLPVHKQMWWWGGAGIVLALALWRLGNVMTPFLLGAGIAYILDPIADRLERSGLKRKWAVGLITVTAVLAFAAVLLLIVPTLIRQITQAIEGLPAFLEKAQAILAAEFPRLIPEGGTLTVAMENAANAISEHGGQVLVTVLSSLGNVLGVMALIVIVPVVAFYLLLDWDGMVARVDELLPREHAPTLRHLGHEIDESLSGFLRGQGLVTLILGTFYAVSLFAVGLPFGLFIGIAAAILSIIPYVGVFIGGVTAIGVALVHFWGEPFWIGAVVAIFAFGQFVEGNYLQPRIIGGHVGLHPVWLMIALAVFGALFGFVGLVVAVPLAAIVGVVARFIAARYKESALYTGREVPPPPLQPTLIELVPRGTVAETRRRAEAAKAVAVAEVRVEEARREAARVAEETAKATGAPAATAAVAVVGDRDRDGRPEVLAAIPLTSAPGEAAAAPAAGGPAPEGGTPPVATAEEADENVHEQARRLREAVRGAAAAALEAGIAEGQAPQTASAAAAATAHPPDPETGEVAAGAAAAAEALFEASGGGSDPAKPSDPAALDSAAPSDPAAPTPDAGRTTTRRA